MFDLIEKRKLMIYSLIAISTSLINSFYYSNIIIMLIFVLIQSLALIYLLLNGKYIKFLAIYIIFLATSLESATFVGTDTFYGFKNFEIFGVNVALIFLIIALIVVLLKIRLRRIFDLKPLTKRFLIWSSLLFVSGLIMGLINILFNDNGVANRITGLGMFINSFYMYFIVIVEFFLISIIIGNDSNKNSEVKASLIAVIYSLAVTMIVSYLFSNFGNRGGLPSLQISNIIMLLIAALGMLFYKPKTKYNFLFAASLIVIFVMGIIFNTNGKMIIIAMLLPFVGIYLIIKNKKYISLIFYLFIGVTSMFITIELILPIILQNNILFEVKYEQAIKLISFWEKGWYSNLPDSPQIRIAQIINILTEYTYKPIQFVFGKGFMGTIKDHNGIFNVLTEFTYSNWEISNGLYYMMHETFNNLLLVNGLAGILFFTYFFIEFIKRIHLSPWMLVGLFWFVLFYNYSLTISIVGVSALVIGINDSFQFYQNEAKKSL